MARLTKLDGIIVGDLSVGGARPAPVKIRGEVLPFEMAPFMALGVEDRLAARSLLWSSATIGVVIEDRDGLFHSARTDAVRPALGAKLTFAARENSTFKSFQLVVLPVLALSGSNTSPSMVSPCHIPAHPTALRPSDKAGMELEKEMAAAVAKWEKWWQRSVSIQQNPPAPPNDLAEDFVRIASALFDAHPSEIGVVSKRGQAITDRLSVDLYETDVRGLGGSTRADIDARIDNAKIGQFDVILQLEADAFKGRDPILGLIGTGIHEAAHYRHYAMTRQLIRKWKASSRANKARKVNLQVLTTDFAKFIDNEVKATRLSQAGRVVVHSTFGATQATHPFAQIHGFMGVYGFYPRERSGKGADGGLKGQARFAQLERAALAWAETRHPIMNTVPFDAIVEYAKAQGQCAVTDLRALAAEVAADPPTNRLVADFYVKLDTALSK